MFPTGTFDHVPVQLIIRCLIPKSPSAPNIANILKLLKAFAMLTNDTIIYTFYIEYS